MVTGPCSEEPLEEPGSFRERLSLLEATEAQPLLRHIYRSTRRLHDQLQRIDPTPPLPRSVVSEVRCFDCGTTKMESFHTSTQGGYHLCPSCFQQRLRTGRARTAH
ncbi:MAG: hypothetical protein E8D43_06660 [Nitrospira sp.]|nr:MAG: hypothetical protein E8D43_06660 [Nitrospira sp.]